ncbi:MAG: SagB family peptide dehydrogenase [Alphaproteobacteria bacterium]|nr:SagB family peptide dehydrogenase [Alphaproteobacteria bacterium]
MASAKTEVIWRFCAEVDSVARDGDHIAITVPDWKTLRFKPESEGIAEALLALFGDGATLEHLRKLAAGDGDGGEESAKALSYYLERMCRPRLLELVLRRDGKDLAVAVSPSNSFAFYSGGLPKDAWRFSRFAYLRRDGEDMVLQSGETPCRITVLPGAAKAFSGFLFDGGGEAGKPVSAGGPGELLFYAGFLEPAEEEEDLDRRCWEFQDRLIHEWSRNNTETDIVGGTYRFKDAFPSAPALKPTMPGTVIDLPKPNLEDGSIDSHPLLSVMENRKSVRESGPEPMNLETLGEFLYRVARIKEVKESSLQDVLSRPYPAGGSINELEFYIAVRRVADMEPLFYHYDGLAHALVALEGTEKVVDKIVRRASAAMGMAEGPFPDMIIVITTRMPRFAWKYQGMAYRTTLTNAGVVTEVLYLVAADMGLAPCGTGTGDSRLFAEATGISPWTETSIGEFVLGSAP